MAQEINAPLISDIQEEPLPIENHFPVMTTGIDFFGLESVICNRKRESQGLTLFTCLVHRAVHLELATDISADSVLHCIRRFVSRRGRPNKLVSVTEAAFAATWHNEI